MHVFFFKTKFLLLALALLADCCNFEFEKQAVELYNETEEKYLLSLLQGDMSQEDSLAHQQDFRESLEKAEKALKKEKCLEEDKLLADVCLIAALSAARTERYSYSNELADRAMAAYLDMENRGVAVDRQSRKMALARMLPLQNGISQLGNELSDFYRGDKKAGAAALSFHRERLLQIEEGAQAPLEEYYQQLEALKPELSGLRKLHLLALSSQLVALKTQSDGLDYLWRRTATESEATRTKIDRFIDQAIEGHIAPEKKRLLEELEELLPAEEYTKWATYWSERIVE